MITEFANVMNTLREKGEFKSEYHDEHTIEIYSEEKYLLNGVLYTYTRTHRLDLCYYVETISINNFDVIYGITYDYSPDETETKVLEINEEEVNKIMKG